MGLKQLGQRLGSGLLNALWGGKSVEVEGKGNTPDSGDLSEAQPCPTGDAKYELLTGGAESFDNR